MISREAIVLAGGLGTRLRSVVSDIPKPMAPVAGRPFIEYVLNELLDWGIDRVVLAVSYKAELVQDHFGNRYEHDGKSCEVVYSIESEPMGTGGGIRHAMSQIKGDWAFIVNGDTLFRADLAAMSASVENGTPSSLILALKEMREFDRYGTVEFDEQGKILGFNEKKACEHGFINGGVYLLKQDVFDGISDQKFSFETEVLEAFGEKGPYYALCFDSYFIDIGIPEDYEKAQTDLAI
jgi:D-glycero-alpha-D-manno-heptose 1-phosphate guanylyltransferase